MRNEYIYQCPECGGLFTDKQASGACHGPAWAMHKATAPTRLATPIPVPESGRLDAIEQQPRARVARVRNGSTPKVAAYLPANFRAEQSFGDVLIVGEDVAGWTLEDYVIPRLASGLIFAEVVQ